MRKILLVVPLVLAACIAGPEGPPGPPGAAGAQGPKGDTTTAGLVNHRWCWGSGTIGGVSLTGWVSRDDFSDGTAYIQCELIASNIPSGAPKISIPIFYPTTSHYNSIGYCPLFHDIETSDGTGKGIVAFWINVGGTVGKLVYDNPDSTYDGKTIPLTCEDNK